MSEPLIHASLGATAYQVALSDGLHQWLSDVPSALGGADTGPSPHQLLLSALGACTAITVAMYAQRKALVLTSIKVELSIVHETTGKPRQTQIGRSIELDGELTTEQRQRLLDVANACPIHQLLIGETQINTQLTE